MAAIGESVWFDAGKGTFLPHSYAFFDQPLKKPHISDKNSFGKFLKGFKLSVAKFQLSTFKTEGGIWGYR